MGSDITILTGALLIITIVSQVGLVTLNLILMREYRLLALRISNSSSLPNTIAGRIPGLAGVRPHKREHPPGEEPGEVNEAVEKKMKARGVRITTGTAQFRKEAK